MFQRALSAGGNMCIQNSRRLVVARSRPNGAGFLRATGLRQRGSGEGARSERREIQVWRAHPASLPSPTEEFVERVDDLLG